VVRIQTPRGARAPRRTRLAVFALSLALATPAAAAVATAEAPAKRGAISSPPRAAGVPPAPNGPQRAPAPARAARTPSSAAALAPADRPRAAFVGAGIGALSAFGTGQSLRVEVDYAILRTPPEWRRLDLEWHLVASFAQPTGTKGLTAQVLPPFGTTPVQVNAGSEKLTALLFEVVPTARALWTPVQGVSFFGDAGVGVAQTFETYDRTEMFLGHSTRREYATGLVLHLGAGFLLDVTPRWRLVFAPAAFDLMTGPKLSAWTPSLGLAFRL
jgi:hypothetical protein